jgi:RHS repeat-associated protein
MQLPVANRAGPVWQPITNLAIVNEGTNYFVQSIVNGNVYLPQTPESFSYDADGNITNDGRWIYTWDAENRLISMTNLLGVPIGAQMSLSFAYDAKGRRVSKSVTTNSITTKQLFVYDGWNLVSILHSDFSLLASFNRGLDLSGSMQGASGIGGLLFFSQPANQASFFTFDGNGNVTALVGATNATISCNYEYGPFGEVVRATGLIAKANPFRFSSQYQDNETDLLCYAFRYYNSSSGSWLSRDPLAESGFRLSHGKLSGHKSLAFSKANDLGYLFVQNSAPNKSDILGLDVYKMEEYASTACTVHHRYIVGDTGEPGHAYRIEVDFVAGTRMWCSTLGVEEYLYLPIHASAKDYVAQQESNSLGWFYQVTGDTLMNHVVTSSDVDRYLDVEAQLLTTQPGEDYVILDHDCGTFANEWLALARSWEKSWYNFNRSGGEDWNPLYDWSWTTGPSWLW